MIRLYCSSSALVSSLTRKLGCVAVCCAVLSGFAQAAQTAPSVSGTPPAVQPAAFDNGKPYANEAIVIEQQRMIFSFAPDGTETRELFVRARVQSDAGVKELGLIDLEYSADLEDLEVKKLEVRKPDGRVRDVSSDAQPDAPTAMTRAAPMYTDQRSRQIPVKGLSVGDVIDEHVIWKGKKPLIPGQFVRAFNFNRQAIVLDANFEVRVPPGRKATLYSGGVQPAERNEAGMHVYVWHDSHTAWTEDERKPKPRTHAKPPDVVLSSFADWASVGQWYSDLQSDRPIVTPAIQAKADELTKNAKTDDEKIRALYDYVSTNIRYIGISLGQGRFQPHTAKEVLENQYGDCKDKHTLLAALLKAQGFEAEPVLIGTAVDPLPNVPAPTWFDHVVTVLPRGDKQLWMDTTPEVAPIGLLLSPLYSRKALVVRAAGHSSLVETAVQPDFPTFDRFIAEGTLDAAKTFKGKIDFTLRGQTEVAFRTVFRAISRSQWEQVTQNISRAMNFAGTVRDVDASQSESLNEPFHLSYGYERKNVGDTEDNSVPVIMPPLQFLYGENDDRPVDTISFGALGETDFVSRVRIPSGKRIDPAPEVKLKTDFAEYAATYSFKDGTWSAQRTLTVLKREIPAARWDEYIKFEKAVFSDENQMGWIVGENERTTTRSTASTHAEKLVNEAADALRDNRFGEAEQLLAQAKAEDPNALYLWRSYSMLEFSRKHLDETLMDAHRELVNHPEEEDYYPWLASFESRVHRDDEALKTWRMLIKQNPANGAGVAGLTAMLIARKQSTEALAIAAKAAESKPDDATIQMALGDAYVAVGKKQESAAAFEKAVKLDGSDFYMNDAAYHLAEANSELDKAAEWSAKATHDQEEKAAALTLDNATLNDFRGMFTLAAYWDTLAWVRFKQGKLQEAEEYSQAAWILSQTSTSGLHYAEVLAAEHKRQQAVETFRLAAGLDPMRKTDALKRLAEYGGINVAAARGEELSKARTILVRQAAKSFESAEFNVLFTDGKISDVRWVEGAESLKSAVDKILRSGYEQPLPSGTRVKIVRRGVLACSPHTAECSFILFMPSDVNS
jgi:tetratricopeptide (TPR) repeat protein